MYSPTIITHLPAFQPIKDIAPLLDADFDPSDFELPDAEALFDDEDTSC
ncbi:MAG TPA: hypothetical protein VFT64_11885 [Rickettsiales bacterium]|nr:hypothetical protein [Rickettsiales bacterium]